MNVAEKLKRRILMDKKSNKTLEQDASEHKELSEHEKFILSQMVNSDVKTIEELGLMYQKQLVEIYQQQNFPMK